LDIGFALTHFLSKAHHLPQVRARLASAAELFWQVYYDEIMRMKWAGGLEPRVVRHTLGCLLARVAGKSPIERWLDEDWASCPNHLPRVRLPRLRSDTDRAWDSTLATGRDISISVQIHASIRSLLTKQSSRRLSMLPAKR
jgi:hypothetical protein